MGSLVARLFEDMTKSPWEGIDKSIADWKAKWSEHLENWKLVKCLPVLELHEAVQDCGPKQGQLRKTVIKAALHPNKKQLSVLLQLALAIWKDGCKHWKFKKGIATQLLNYLLSFIEANSQKKKEGNA